MNDKERVAREAREKALRNKYSEKLGYDIYSLPLRTERMIGIQAALGEDFDQEKTEKVLKAFDGFDDENGDLFRRFGGEFVKFTPGAIDEWKMIQRRLWTTINDILGPEDFLKKFDENVEDAIAIMCGFADYGIAVHQENQKS